MSSGAVGAQGFDFVAYGWIAMVLGAVVASVATLMFARSYTKRDVHQRFSTAGVILVCGALWVVVFGIVLALFVSATKFEPY